MIKKFSFSDQFLLTSYPSIMTSLMMTKKVWSKKRATTAKNNRANKISARYTKKSKSKTKISKKLFTKKTKRIRKKPQPKIRALNKTTFRIKLVKLSIKPRMLNTFKNLSPLNCDQFTYCMYMFCIQSLNWKYRKKQLGLNCFHKVLWCVCAMNKNKSGEDNEKKILGTCSGKSYTRGRIR